MAAPTGKTYIVEHLDEELGSWSELEYIAIGKETHQCLQLARVVVVKDLIRDRIHIGPVKGRPGGIGAQELVVGRGAF